MPIPKAWRIRSLALPNRGAIGTGMNPWTGIRREALLPPVAGPSETSRPGPAARSTARWGERGEAEGRLAQRAGPGARRPEAAALLAVGPSQGTVLTGGAVAPRVGQTFLPFQRHSDGPWPGRAGLTGQGRVGGWTICSVRTVLGNAYGAGHHRQGRA